jgi:hypothetical protein
VVKCEKNAVTFVDFDASLSSSSHSLP